MIKKNSNNKIYISKYFYDKLGFANKKNTTKLLVFNAIIAALYVAITFAISPIGYNAIQFRISELLNWLTWMNPSAVFGLVLGCFISNINSPFGIVDCIFGTTATLFTCLCMSYTPNKYIASIYAALFSILIGIEFIITGVPFSAAIIDTGCIMISEFIIMAIIGIPIITILERKYLKNE